MLFLIVLIAFPFVMWGAYKNVQLSKTSATWPTAPGVVTASTRTKKGWRVQPSVTYSYNAEGKTYSSSKISFAALVPANKTEPTLARYPLSQPVTVHYQPGNPAVAVLEAGPNLDVSRTMWSYVYLFSILVLINIALLGLDIWDATHKSDSDTPTYGDQPSASSAPAASTTAAAPTAAALAATDLQEGNNLLRADADKGNAQDQAYVGMWYLTGAQGYTKDPVEAAKWLQKSADQGNSDGQYMLGQLYAKGLGVTKDVPKAVDLFQKSAAQNNPHACASLGHAYELGAGGLPQDNAKAIEWYRKAGNEPHAKEGLARLGAQ